MFTLLPPIQALRYIIFFNMHNSKVYLILKDFDKYEQNRCRKYVESPYFNRSEILIDLFDVYIRYANSKKEEEFTKEMVWEKLHSDKEFDDTRWRKYVSDLLKLVEGYLLQEEFQKDKYLKTAFLMDAISERKITSLSSSVINKSKKEINNSILRNSDWYYNKYNLEKKKYQLGQADRQRAEVSNIESIITNLDDFFILEKLKYYFDVLSRTSTVSHNYEVKMIDEIIIYLENQKKEDLNPAIRIYYKMILTYKHIEDESHYFELKELMEENVAVFSQTEALGAYSSIINYCTRKLHSGNQKFWREYFEIHQQLLENKIIIVDGELSIGIFKNIVTTALRLEEVNWVKTFIEEYKIYLPEKQRENAVAFNSALLFSHQKEYDKVIRLLQEVEYEDFIYNLNAKTLLLITYFETDEQEALFSLIDSFRAYLYRQKNISNKLKVMYSNFLKYTKKLAKLSYKDKSQIGSLKEEVSTVAAIASRSWLLKKITELQK